MIEARLFGKLPAHGDFVTRGLGAADRDALDLWLSDSLSQARDLLGDDFVDHYDVAPPWRFVAPEGPNGSGAWVAGAIAPSIDSAGRRFPILIALTGLSDDRAPGAAEACEGLLYEALGGGWTADALFAAARALPAEAGEEIVEEAFWWTLGGDEFDPVSLSGARPYNLFRTMLAKRKDAA